jgi:hypothetical protein
MYVGTGYGREMFKIFNMHTRYSRTAEEETIDIFELGKYKQKIVD